MKLLWYALFTLALMSCATAVIDKGTVDITLHTNNLVEEHVNLLITPDQPYDSVDFTVEHQPLTVLFNGAYTLADQGNNTVITFNKSLSRGVNTLEFTLLFDDLITSQGASNAFSIQFEGLAAVLDVAVHLPVGYVLAATSPAVSPKPDSVTTDGRALTLHWANQTSDLGVIVLYDSPPTSWLLFAGIAVLIIVAGIAVFYALRRRQHHIHKSVLLATLNDDEKLIVSLINQGVNKQKALCQQSGFSKSKMSKVIRKLEEKNVVRKEPFFKTNKLELTASWKHR